MFAGARRKAGISAGQRSAAMAAVLVTVLAAAGCGSAAAPPVPSTRPGDAGEIAGAAVQMTLRVYVDQPMRAAFSDFTKSFQVGHPGTQIQLKFKRSRELVDELVKGPAPDVLVVEDQDMNRAAQSGQVSDPKVFASDRLVIVTPPGNPNRVVTFNDVTRPGTRLAVCAPELACGVATARVASSLSVQLSPAQTEESASGVVDAVADGRADVGLTYSSYVKGAETRVTTSSFSGDAVSVERYSIAVTTKSENQTRAKQLVGWMLTGDGHRFMANFGFGSP